VSARLEKKRAPAARAAIGLAAAALIVLSAAPARAQLNGENLLGDNGVRSGSQPAPGLYLANLYTFYSTDTIKNANGDRVVIDPTRAGSQRLHVIAPLVIYVSKAKVFGGHYGMMAVVPLANGALEAPGFGLDEGVSIGLADMYLVPFQLGWHLPRAGPDVTIPIASRSKLISLVNVRYLWEGGAQMKTQGQSLLVTATFPVPSLGIPHK
jgi:hypothetical protein